jgi:hypothetical protein
MSIGSIVSNTWTPPPFRPQSTDGFANAAPAWVSSTSTATGASATGAANPFQQLSADIQALLVQAQGGIATTAAAITGNATTAPVASAAGANASGATTATDPEQQLATDLQSLLAQLQNTNTASGQNDPTAGTGQVQPHHHHHHHHGGGGQEATNQASAAGGTTASSTTASPTATASGTTASASDQVVSRSIAADIMQALQAYGSTTPAVTGATLTA